ncbi:hypothetical protein ACFO25_10505 [Paenactinomyces guangxiensis]|uniref:Uncharacterized protein n=1 Tax=Paenactinomyces guangxiensis TaxID=1490290 RepID=A0A7W1WQT1_9BACL|nr:hypothetical protein [Paenactinomyces guangxiensis]MBA4494171.1 hypothetical protein [Paenactinomyces guangxiensis]MBH8591084.1 hypothetical protein [Paenactinomyces guangxiensis]
MPKKETVHYVSDIQAVSYIVYVLAKLGYSRSQITVVTRELQKMFDLRCTSRTFDNSLIKGRAERKKWLPTIRSDQTSPDDQD